MSSPVDLGYRPRRINVILSRRQDWIAGFTRASTDPVWPPNTVVVMRFYSDAALDDEIAFTTGTVTSTTVTFHLESATADTLPGGTQARCYVSYPGGDDYTWLKGKVVRDD